MVQSNNPRASIQVGERPPRAFGIYRPLRNAHCWPINRGKQVSDWGFPLVHPPEVSACDAERIGPWLSNLVSPNGANPIFKVSKGPPTSKPQHTSGPQSFLHINNTFSRNLPTRSKRSHKNTVNMKTFAVAATLALATVASAQLDNIPSCAVCCLIRMLPTNAILTIP